MSKDISILIHRQEHTFEEVKVTPQIAGQLLKNNYDNNRPLRPGVITSYAKRMSEGGWNPLAADPIKVSKTGKLLNGQHRMNAIIVSGETITCTIETGLEEKDYKFIDQGKARIAADIIGKVPSRFAVAAGLKTIINWERGTRTPTLFQNKVDNKEIGEWLEDHDIEEIDIPTFHLWKNVLNLPPSVTFLFVWLAQEKDPAAFDEFSSLLVGGTGLDADHPVWRVREWLLSGKRKSYPRGRDLFLIFMMLVKAWNLWREGKTCKLIKPDKEWKGMI